MKMVTKKLLTGFVLWFISSSLLAVDIGKGNGKLEVGIKAMTVLSAKKNRYDPNNGTSDLAKIKYETPKWNNLKLGVGLYNSGDLLDLLILKPRELLGECLLQMTVQINPKLVSFT